MKIMALIVTYNRLELLKRILKTYDEQIKFERMEIKRRNI